MASWADVLRWDHNAHYHRYLLRHLPMRMDRALDVGCGAGAFAGELARRTTRVDAIDVSSEMLAVAREQSTAPNVDWVLGDVLTADLPQGSYDAITAIASLHHLPLEPALTRLAELVRPGGVVAVLGISRDASPADYARSVAAVPLNLLMGTWHSMRGTLTSPADRMPVREPETTLPEIRSASRAAMPGGRIRRHLFFRYSLIWHRPDARG